MCVVVDVRLNLSAPFWQGGRKTQLVTFTGATIWDKSNGAIITVSGAGFSGLRVMCCVVLWLFSHFVVTHTGRTSILLTGWYSEDPAYQYPGNSVNISVSVTKEGILVVVVLRIHARVPCTGSITPSVSAIELAPSGCVCEFVFVLFMLILVAAPIRQRPSPTQSTKQLRQNDLRLSISWLLLVLPL